MIIASYLVFFFSFLFLPSPLHVSLVVRIREYRLRIFTYWREAGGVVGVGWLDGEG